MSNIWFENQLMKWKIRNLISDVGEMQALIEQLNRRIERLESDRSNNNTDIEVEND